MDRSRLVSRLVVIAITIGVVGAGRATFAAARPASPSVKGKYVCSGAQVTIFNNTNVESVDDGGVAPTFSTRGKAYCVTYIQTYHWNDGDGAAPGTLGLKQVSVSIPTLPTEIGPLKAQGTAGANGKPNENWYVDVPHTPPQIVDGRYDCIDSGEASWSSNKDSGGAGFCIVYAVPAQYAIAH